MNYTAFMCKAYLIPYFRLDGNRVKWCGHLLKFDIISTLACLTLMDVLFHISPQGLPIKPCCDFLASFVSPEMPPLKESKYRTHL